MQRRLEPVTRDPFIKRGRPLMRAVARQAQAAGSACAALIHPH
jgi:hypothetical protein